MPDQVDALSSDSRKPQFERFCFTGRDRLNNAEKLFSVCDVSFISFPIG